jgi:peptidoglycan hydrolase-like protein with peptidoglycan-binding domain
MRKFGIRIKTVVASTAVLAGGLAGGVLVSQPTAAAAPSCTDNSTIVRFGSSYTIPSIGRNTGNLNCILGVGNQSAAVSNLQANLNLCYWAGSSIPGRRPILSERLATDGIYGPRTREAVRAAQRDASITADGVYGPQTRRSILFLAERDDRFRCSRFGV